jgi:aspartyl protease family protein
MNNVIAGCLILLTLIGCSKSRQREQNIKSETRQNHASNKIKMKKIGGVYQIPVEVNGLKLYFIFDTGASSISISAAEVSTMFKQGILSEEDILGTANFIDANGDINEGTLINLKEIRIGSKVLYNVQAGVVHNLNAPLLLGQSALERFGEISIDNKTGYVTFR